MTREREELKKNCIEQKELIDNLFENHSITISTLSDEQMKYLLEIKELAYKAYNDVVVENKLDEIGWL